MRLRLWPGCGCRPPWDGRVLVAAAALRFLAVFFFGFGVLPRAARAFTRARLVFREPADLAFRRLVRSAIGVDPSEVARRIQDSDVIRFLISHRPRPPTCSCPVRRPQADVGFDCQHSTTRPRRHRRGATQLHATLRPEQAEGEGVAQGLDRKLGLVAVPGNRPEGYVLNVEHGYLENVAPGCPPLLAPP